MINEDLQEVKELKKAITTIWKSKERGRVFLVFSEMVNENLRDSGLLNDKIVIADTILKKISCKHHLKAKDIVNIQHALENPVAILKRDNRVIVVTDVVDYQNNPVIAVLGADGKENYVASVYGRNNISDFLLKHVSCGNALFMDLDKVEFIRNEKTSESLDKIKRKVLEGKGCKLRMTIERNGEKIHLTENEIWAAYSLVQQNITPEVEQEVKEQLRERKMGD